MTQIKFIKDEDGNIISPVTNKFRINVYRVWGIPDIELMM